MVAQSRTFPHLLAADAALWEKFLPRIELEFTHFDYDIRVGDGRDPGDGYIESIRQMAVDLSQRRIDAIGYKDDSLTIFEITSSCGFTAIGQILGYPVLYNILYAPTVRVDTAIVAGRIQDDIKPVLDSLNIKYFIV
jgi:hypothetical protein